MKYARSLAFATAFVITAHAESPSNDLTPIHNNPPLMVTATRVETPVDEIGRSVSLISAEDIRTQHSLNAQSALRRVPGIQLSQSGAPGTASSVFIRGSESSHTAVLINGVRVNSNTTGAFNLSSLPANAIDRIEVVRGSHSSHYGSEAIGGVINIITKKGVNMEEGASITLEGGEKGFFNSNLQVAGGNEKMDGFISLNAQGLDDYDIAGNYGGTENDKYRNTSATSGFGFTFLEDGRADITLLYNRTKNDIDNYATFPNWWQADDPNRHTETEMFVSTLNAAKPLSETASQNLSLGYNLQKNRGYDNGSREYTYDTWNVDAGTQTDLKLSPNNLLSVGYDFRHSEAENKGNYDTRKRDQHALILSDNLSFDDQIFLNLGLRYDEFSDIDGQATWSAAGSWQFTETSRLHSSLGTGYKAPTLNDLYWPTTTFTGGNPDLSPEESLSFDLGVEQFFWSDRCMIDLTYFQNQVDDLISWQADSFGFYSPMNVNEAEIQGLEFLLTTMPADTVTLQLFYTWTEAEDKETGNQLARRAEHTGGASIDWQACSRFLITTDYQVVGSRYDDPANQRKLDSYGIVNLNGRLQLSERCVLLLNVANLFDEDYENAAGYGTVGRVASLGIDLRL